MNCLRRFCTFAFLMMVCLTTFESASAQTATTKTKAPSPELVEQLTKQLSITPAQATGGAGTLFNLAKTNLSAADFSKIAAVVPGMGGFLKAAPAADSLGGLSSLTGSLPGNVGGMASAATSFQKLGLSPDMVTKFVPVLTNFVQSKGGASVASLLSGALK